MSAVLQARDAEFPSRLIACTRSVAEGPDTELWWDAVGEVRTCSTASDAVPGGCGKSSQLKHAVPAPLGIPCVDDAISPSWMQV